MANQAEYAFLDQEISKAIKARFSGYGENSGFDVEIVVRVKPRYSGTTLLDRACEEVGWKFGFERQELLKPSKARDIVEARRYLFAILRATGRSFPTIARMCGGFDHSTVLHGVTHAHEKFGEKIFKEIGEQIA